MDIGHIRRVTRPGPFQRYGYPLAITLTIGFSALIGQPTGAALAASGCGTTTPAAVVTTSPPAASPSRNAAIPTEAAIQPEQNPAGDIPDTQAFVTYTSATGGYSISIPEGWARMESGTSVTFSDKLHQFGVELGCAASPPTVDTANAEATSQLSKTIPAFALIEVKAVALPSGQAILVRYQANSAPDDVTGKQHRLDVDRYEIFKDGKRAILSIASPAGSDNVDVSRQVSESFRWLA